MKKILIALFLVTLAGTPASFSQDAAAPSPSVAKDSRCFEMRTYYAAPGKLDALHARFRDHTNKLFVKHGMTLIGYWSPIDAKDAEQKMIYILAYPSKEAATRSWKDFQNDEDWKTAKAA